MEKIKLDDLQLKIMKVLWQLGRASVSQIQAVLKEEREFAITTIATVLQRLSKKGIVGFEKEGRQYVYSPKVSEKETQDSMADSLVEQLFQGKSSSLVHHLLQSRDFNIEELENLKSLIEEAQQKKRS